MDFEEGIDNEHFDMRTGRPCANDDDADWTILEVPDREDWENAH